MRRSDREITDEQELLQVISECDVCRLALNDEEVPYILPLNFGEEVSGGRLYLYFHGAAEGRKYDLISRDPQTAFEMDCSHRIVLDESRGYCTMEYRSVIGQGSTDPRFPRRKTFHALTLIMRHYHPEHTDFNPAAIPRTRVLKLEVTSMTLASAGMHFSKDNFSAKKKNFKKGTCRISGDYVGTLDQYDITLAQNSYTFVWTNI